LGFVWKENVDLDLYAAAHSGAETLFFQHTRSPEGYYYKDHRSSPGREYEFIDSNRRDIREVEAMVNFYKGHLQAARMEKCASNLTDGFMARRFSSKQSKETGPLRCRPGRVLDTNSDPGNSQAENGKGGEVRARPAKSRSVWSATYSVAF